MFTGIIEAVGRVVMAEGGSDGRRLVIEAEGIVDGLEIGDSIAVNGACLTVISVDPPRLTVETVVETLRRTNLGAILADDRVNLERALPVTGRFEGHIVQGHVDGVGEIRSIRPEKRGSRLEVGVSPMLVRHLVEKGSVAVDGVSLTVAGLGEASFETALIPHTLQHTTLGERAPGDTVNVEVDILAKYVERLLTER